MFLDNFYREQKIKSQLLEFCIKFSSDILSMFGLFGVLILLIISFFGSYIAPYSFDQQFVNYKLVSPSLSCYGKFIFFLGTDELGCDILSKLLIGTKYTFGSALLITIISIIFSLIIGCISSIKNGFNSIYLNHILDVFLCIPSILIAIIITVFIGINLKNAILAICLSLIPRMINTVHTILCNELNKEYVIAVRIDGASNLFILFYIIFPNIIHILVTEYTHVFSIAIFDIISLGFLGLSVQSNFPELGAMLGRSLNLIYIAPWVFFIPCVTVIFCVLFVNMLGYGIYKSINKRINNDYIRYS